MMKVKRLLTVFLLLNVLACPAFAARHGGGELQRVQPARVMRVLDGNTILAAFFDGSEPERVRLIGADTPAGSENYGKEASDFTVTMLSNSDVWLQFDARRRDRGRRLLAYVWTAEPRSLRDEDEIRRYMFNARLILDGYARAAADRPNTRYARLFSEFQREARETNRGLWWRH